MELLLPSAIRMGRLSCSSYCDVWSRLTSHQLGRAREAVSQMYASFSARRAKCATSISIGFLDSSPCGKQCRFAIWRSDELQAGDRDAGAVQRDRDGQGGV